MFDIKSTGSGFRVEFDRPMGLYTGSGDSWGTSPWWLWVIITLLMMGLGAIALSVMAPFM